MPLATTPSDVDSGQRPIRYIVVRVEPVIRGWDINECRREPRIRVVRAVDEVDPDTRDEGRPKETESKRKNTKGRQVRSVTFNHRVEPERK